MKTDDVRCENCDRAIVGFSAANYQGETVFCSIQCSEEYYGDDESDNEPCAECGSPFHSTFHCEYDEFDA